jgi:acyl-CoA synthetase (AMP-forming)/AMP-acid ligase II
MDSWRVTSLWELVERRAEATPDALFAIDGNDRTLSFGAYRTEAERVAAALAAHGGVRAGAVVAWMLPTTIDALVLVAALARLGAVQAPLLTSYGRREVAFVLGQTAARLFVVAPRHRGHDLLGTARAAAGDVPVVDSAVLVRADDSPAPPPAPPAPDEVRWLYYTSGTTAEPKGVRHTDATLAAAARGLVEAFQLGPGDRAALVFPVAHVGGCLWLMASLLSGAAAITLDVWNDDAIRALARHGVTQAGAGPVFHQAYLAAQRARPDAPLFPCVRAFPGGGAPKPPALHYAVKGELGGAGIVSGYGLTECPAVAMNCIGDPDEKLAHTEGRPSPRERAEIRIVEGEVRVKGPQLFRGYVDASLDRGAFDDHGFFRTGDLGELDADGYLRITGRLKDVIIRKGENISAKEVEDLLYVHPKIADVAVIGVADPELGEMCCAVVVAKDSRALPLLPELAAFLAAEGLMRQKIPERLEIVGELPRNANGKVDRRALRQRFAIG